MVDANKVFEALPHVNKIWVIGDEFHLHPFNGGKEINRDADVEIKTESQPQPQTEKRTYTKRT